jgi:rsbT co-antagonist protein RsbR
MPVDPALQLLHHSPFAVILVSGDLQVRGWNLCAAEIFGLEQDAAIGRDLGALLPHPGWRAALATDDTIMITITSTREAAAITCEVQHQPHDGGHLLYVRDVSERHARTLQYRRQEHLLRAIVDNLDVIVWSVDPDGTFNYQEGKALATAGLRPGQFIGQNVFDLYAGQGGSQSIRDAMLGRSDHNVTTVHGLHWENWYVPVRDEAGAVIGCAGVTMDVTTARNRERELQAKLDVIEHQQRLIRGLSTPIIEVWDRVLTVPMVGLIDSSRAVDLMDSLLQAVTRTRSRFAVLDLTGIEALDTASAGGLVSLIHAVRLLGAEGIVTGIHPSVAQTIVALGVDLSAFPVFADLRSALGHCITRLGAPAVADRRR